MAMQVTMTDPETGETFVGTPARDIAWFGPQIFKQIGDRCLPKNLTPEEYEALDLAHVDYTQVFDAWEALTRFHKIASDPAVKTVPAAIEESGFLKCHVLAQNIVLQKYSKGMLGAIWAGLRSSTMGDTCPSVVTNLLKKADELSNHLERR